jgi:hypothetical protein
MYCPYIVVVGKGEFCCLLFAEMCLLWCWFCFTDGGYDVHAGCNLLSYHFFFDNVLIGKS